MVGPESVVCEQDGCWIRKYVAIIIIILANIVITVARGRVRIVLPPTVCRPLFLDSAASAKKARMRQTVLTQRKFQDCSQLEQSIYPRRQGDPASPRYQLHNAFLKLDFKSAKLVE